jgi:proprotein convertase subtilisin/kexin type 5
MLYVVSTGQCILTCPTGMASIYSNNINQCINCLATNCSQCSTGNISICTVCKTGYYLLTGSCYQTCPSGTIAYQQICQTCYTLNCQICPTLLSCNACLYGYYLTIDSQCVANCPFGTTSSISASNVSICEPCKTGCINCSNATITCNECMTGLIPTANGSCQYNTTRYCLIGRYLIQINPLICGICDISCNDCYGNSKSQCFTCNIPTYLMQNG